MPTFRRDLAASAVNGMIYAFGGHNGNERLTTVEIYNPAADTWKKGADMSAPRSQFATAAVDGKIYLFGGFSVVERRGKKIEKTMAIVEVYDPAADAWEQKGKALTARTRMGASVVNGKVYITGGYRNTGGGADHLEIYDPATDTWQNGAKLFEARWLLTSAAVNGKVYIFGGFVKPRLLEVVEEYDPATNQWSKKADLPNPRQELSHSSPVVDGKVYVMGGNDLNGTLASVDVYDAATDTWEKGKKMPTIRESLATVQVKGKIYAIGGWGPGGKLLATVEEFTPDGWPFAVSPQGKLATTWGGIKAMN